MVPQAGAFPHTVPQRWRALTHLIINLSLKCNCHFNSQTDSGQQNPAPGDKDFPWLLFFPIETSPREGGWFSRESWVPSHGLGSSVSAPPPRGVCERPGCGQPRIWGRQPLLGPKVPQCCLSCRTRSGAAPEAGPFSLRAKQAP